MRIAMSCFAFPVLGRPTRRARFSSSFVDSGISEKSIGSTRVSFAFFRARPASGDDPNRFFAILPSPVGIDQNNNAAQCGDSQSLETDLPLGVLRVFPFQRLGIREYGGRFLERDAMLFKIPGSFSGIPGEHNLCIYNNYHGEVKSESYSVASQAGFCGRPWKLFCFDWLTSIVMGSIKILTRPSLQSARIRRVPSELKNENWARGQALDAPLRRGLDWRDFFYLVKSLARRESSRGCRQIYGARLLQFHQLPRQRETSRRKPHFPKRIQHLGSKRQAC